MTTLSIVLPDALAKASKEVARHLGLSRSELIRQAVMHEIENFKSQIEQKAIINSMMAMKKSQKYMKEVEEITQQLNSVLPKDKEQWWGKKKS